MILSKKTINKTLIWGLSIFLVVIIILYIINRSFDKETFGPRVNPKKKVAVQKVVAVPKVEVVAVPKVEVVPKKVPVISKVPAPVVPKEVQNPYINDDRS
jgi:hypothetical protein